MRKIQLYKILFLIGFWICCVIFITIYDSAILGFKSEIKGEHYSFTQSLLVSIVNCIIGASILASLEVLYLGKLLRKKPFGTTLSLFINLDHFKKATGQRTRAKIKTKGARSQDTEESLQELLVEDKGQYDLREDNLALSGIIGDYNKYWR